MQAKIIQKIEKLRENSKAISQAISEDLSVADHYTSELLIIDELIVDLEFTGATHLELCFQRDLLVQRMSFFKDIQAAAPDNKRNGLAIERGEAELEKLNTEISLLEKKINHLLQM